MTQHYIRRTLEKIIKKAAAEFPAVILTAPRQSGKITPIMAFQLYPNLPGTRCPLPSPSGGPDPVQELFKSVGRPSRSTHLLK